MRERDKRERGEKRRVRRLPWEAAVLAVVLSHGALADAVDPPASPPDTSTQPIPQPPAGEEGDRFLTHVQATYVWSRKYSFAAPYTGPQSLLPVVETSYSLSTTLYLGQRLWKGGELYEQPEAFAALPLSNLFGLAAVQNGELQKASGQTLRSYVARLFLRQTVSLGGDSFQVPADFNQLETAYTRRRLVFTVGKVSILDLFEKSNYANDPRTQFLNWALINYGAYDYAGNARGYNVGVTGELYWDDWAIRAGRYMEPTVPNGASLTIDLFRFYGDQVELEHDHEIAGHPGVVRVLVFHNYVDAGRYQDALARAASTGSIPDLLSVRRPSGKTGYGASVEQTIDPVVAVWARAMYADDQAQEYAFTEIDNSISAGLSLKGAPWHRGSDTLGVAFSSDGLNGWHRAYLAAGGPGGFIGDGRLNYARETVAETYYSALVRRDTYLTLDYQCIVNPGYNLDRHGPVNIVSARFHITL